MWSPARPARPRGLLFDGSYGGDERALNVRYGGRIGDNLAYRIYGLGFGRDNTFTAAGASANDGWRMFQGGTRADWTGPRRHRDPAGRCLQRQVGEGAPPRWPGATSAGGDVEVRWNHAFAESSASTSHRISAATAG